MTWGEFKKAMEEQMQYQGVAVEKVDEVEVAYIDIGGFGPDYLDVTVKTNDDGSSFVEVT